MNKSVEQKMSELLEVFNSLPNCKIEKNEGDRLLIVSDKPVSWADEASMHKIGSIAPHKTSLGLYIDFPHNYLDVERIEDVINADGTLDYCPPGTKTSTVKSWWRFRSDEKFDSLHMVLRKSELDMYDVKREEWVELMEEITRVHQ